MVLPQNQEPKQIAPNPCSHVCQLLHLASVARKFKIYVTTYDKLIVLHNGSELFDA